MITYYFTSIFAFYYLFLTFKTIRTRRKVKIAIGNSDNENLTRINRVHGNFSEYAPITIILAYFCELSGINKILLSLILTSFIIGRFFHYYGLIIEEPKYKIIRFRIIGMVITTSCIGLLALILIFL
jgi:uncharacterized membrane protein YecN with MAPEG domain